jgi:hypothetical protein
MYTSKQLVSLALLSSVVISSLFYILICSAGGGCLVIAEPDQLQYLQYGKNVAQGHPYIFVKGDTLSTGCTSHLYPFALGLLYKLGATGSAYLTASFIFNALIYMGIVVLSWSIAKKLYPAAATATLFLSVIGGHTLAAVFGQTDVGFFALFALALFASLLHGKVSCSLILAVLCPWVRPEGFVFAIANILTWSISAVVPHRGYSKEMPSNAQSRPFLICGLCGIASFIGMLMLNHALTDHYQFMSVANKGYFKNFPVMGAIQHTLMDLMDLLKGFFLGISSSSRQFYHIPFLGALLAFTGILFRPRKNMLGWLGEIWFSLSVVGSLLLIASSQWQGLSMDRYLTWLFPAWTLYILIGVYEVKKRIHISLFFPLILIVLTAFLLLSLVFVSTIKYNNATKLNTERLFAQHIDTQIDSSKSIGSVRGGGLAFYMPERKSYNLYGVNSPDFFDEDSGLLLKLIDRVKHRPDLRFDYWLAPINFTNENTWAEPFFGELVMSDTDSSLGNPDALCLFKAVWTTLENGNTPKETYIEPMKWACIDSLDIGNLQQERNHAYSSTIRLRNLKLPLTAKNAKLADNEYSENGRIVLGGEAFTIHSLTPHKAARIVLRTSKTVEGTCYKGSSLARITGLEMNDTLKLSARVNSVEIPLQPFKLRGSEFEELIFDLPAEAITATTCRVEIIGDHISFAYWFYQ